MMNGRVWLLVLMIHHQFVGGKDRHMLFRYVNDEGYQLRNEKKRKRNPVKERFRFRFRKRAGSA